MANTLRVIFGDQLSMHLETLRGADHDHDRVLMMEVHDEAQYVPQHPKKIVFILSAMRHFAQELEADGYSVDYLQMGSSRSRGSFTDTLVHYLKRRSFKRVVVTEPSEYRVLEMVRGWSALTGLSVEIRQDQRFIASHDDFSDWAAGKKQLRMEFFYREMRKRAGLLMEEGKPVGGKWNYDKENRKPASEHLKFPAPKRFVPDPVTRDVIRLVNKQFGAHFGDVEPFWFAVTAKDAQQAFRHFVRHALPAFGDYQDAMLADQNFLYHSVISHYLNVGLLDPIEVCEQAEAAYRSGDAPLNAVEGFIRQILGWREFVRGVYWLKMPEYARRNHLAASRPLPPSYWGGETQMNCITQVVKQTQQQAYSHHIQRLMITGNFALLTGVSPAAIHEWYLAVYADAFEWVEMPNTLGMAVFADGGIVGTKPYAASGAYINKMSDYCKSCHYSVKDKNGERACPFNYLYWNFLDQHRGKLRDNHRLAFPYRQLEKFSDQKLAAIRADSRRFLATEFAHESTQS